MIVPKVQGHFFCPLSHPTWGWIMFGIQDCPISSLALKWVARAKNRIDRNLGNGVRNQLFALIPEHRRWSYFVASSKANRTVKIETIGQCNWGRSASEFYFLGDSYKPLDRKKRMKQSSCRLARGHFNHSHLIRRSAIELESRRPPETAKFSHSSLHIL